MEKSNKRMTISKIVLITLLLLGVVATAVGLGITIKYSYLDKISHYHEALCHENNCSMIQTQCCIPGNNLDNTNNCEVCYDVEITYSLISWVNNSFTDIYTKTARTNTFDPKYCDQFNKIQRVTCYFDDHNIANSLRLWNPYEAGVVVLGIILLSCWLTFLIFLTVLASGVIYHDSKSKSQTKESYSNE